VVGGLAAWHLFNRKKPCAGLRKPAAVIPAIVNLRAHESYIAAAIG